MPVDGDNTNAMNVTSRINYQDRFDYVINHIAVKAFGQDDVVSGLLVTATYLHIMRMAAADAGIKIGINPYETAKIFLIFEALKFQKKKTLIDKLFGKKRDIENIHVKMCEMSMQLYMQPKREFMFDWGAAYVDCLMERFESLKETENQAE